MMINIKKVTNKILIILVFTILFILLSLLENKIVFGVTRIPKADGKFTIGNTYSANLRDLTNSNKLFCIEPGQIEPWGTNPDKVIDYNAVGYVKIDTTKKNKNERIVKNKVYKSDNDLLKIGYAFALKDKLLR